MIKDVPRLFIGESLQDMYICLAPNDWYWKCGEEIIPIEGWGFLEYLSMN